MKLEGQILAARLIKYIEQHATTAYFDKEENCLFGFIWEGCPNNEWRLVLEKIDLPWQAVRDWLGY